MVLGGGGLLRGEVALYRCFLGLGFREPWGRKEKGERERERQKERQSEKERDRERERIEAVHVIGSLNIKCRPSS